MSKRPSLHPMRPFWQGYAFRDEVLELEFRDKFWAWTQIPNNLWCIVQILLAISFILRGCLNWERSTVLIHLFPITVATIGLVALNYKAVARHLRRHVELLMVTLYILVTAYYCWNLNQETERKVQLALSTRLAGVMAQVHGNEQLVSDLEGYVRSSVTANFANLQMIYNSLQLIHLCVSGFSWTMLFGVLGISSLSSAGFLLNPYMPRQIALFGIIFGVIVALLYTVFLSLGIAKLRRKQFAIEHQFANDLETAVIVAQNADTILNHTLKNTMADACGEIEIFLHENDNRDPHLITSMECLRRGMRSCQHRQAYLKLSAHRYTPSFSPVRLDQFGAELAAGRNMTVSFVSGTVLIDKVLCSLILDNALNNAFKHGHGVDPEVTFTIEESATLASLGVSHATTDKIPLVFTVTNRANPCRPPLTEHFISSLLSGEAIQEETSPPLSSGDGLQYSVLAAEVHGASLHLSQEGDVVIFRTSLWASTASPALCPSSAVHVADTGVPQSQLKVYCIDDSACARRLMTYHLMRHSTCGAVYSFGECASDVSVFIEGTLREANVAILDEHLDFPGGTLVLGSDLVRQLRRDKYSGVLCIRSANVSENEKARYFSAGADLVFGKDLPMPQVLQQIDEFVAHHSSTHASNRSPPHPSNIGVDGQWAHGRRRSKIVECLGFGTYVQPFSQTLSHHQLLLPGQSSTESFTPSAFSVSSRSNLL